METAALAAADKLADGIIAYDVSDQLVITDAFLLCSAPNDRQVKAIVDEVEVIGRQQDLAGADAVPGEGGRVPGDEQALADAGRCLLGGDIPLDETGQAQADRAARLLAGLRPDLIISSDLSSAPESAARRSRPSGRAATAPAARGRSVRPGRDQAGPGRQSRPGRQQRRATKQGIGGMATKVEAAMIASAAGIPTVVADAASAAAALSGAPAGTYFAAAGGRRPATRLLWLKHAAVARGSLRLDSGAVEAVVSKRASLLPAGITGVEGTFDAGDPVNLLGEDGNIVARGLVNYDAAEIPGLMGRSTRWLASKLGQEYEREVVHRDDLVLC